MHLKIYFIKQFFGIDLRFYYVNAFSFNAVVILDWVYHLPNRRDDFQIYFLGEKWSLLSRESTWKQSWGKKVALSEFRDPGLWGSEELTELSHSSLCKRKAIEWLVLFEPWELVQKSVCFWMYGVLCAVSPFSLDWRKIFISLPKFGLC